MTRYNSLVLALLVMALTGYLLPWIVAPSSSMTLNAFDLAEWTSLHPLQHSSPIPLLVPLQLRLQLLILLTIFALVSRDLLPVKLVASVVVLVAVAQLPPPEFIGQLHNANYRQQFALACASAVLPLLLWRIKRKRLKMRVVVSLSAVGAAFALAGHRQAETLLRLALEEGQPGLGLFIVAAAYIAVMLLTLRQAGFRLSRGF